MQHHTSIFDVLHSLSYRSHEGSDVLHFSYRRACVSGKGALSATVGRVVDLGRRLLKRERKRGIKGGFKVL